MSERSRGREQTSEWPSTYVPILGCSAPQCDDGPGWREDSYSWNTRREYKEAASVPHRGTSFILPPRPGSVGQRRKGIQARKAEVNDIESTRFPLV